ncbi:phosphatidate cytidylyltransferase [Singulisphaera sp. PoT]|uniref:phosphatidate cytidylyltransferase n=1 Tax=Singulisphaera sp. PoT TaxID=3411797 RepID=UPI003BF4698A
MLSTRLTIGLTMVGAILFILCVDEWFFPWYPAWFLLAIVALGLASLELVALLANSEMRSSGNTVFGGIMALIIANWAPHLAHQLTHPARLPAPLTFDPLTPINAIGWPLLTYAGVIMGAFLIQSVQFRKPGSTMTSIAGSILSVSYVGILGSFIIQMRWFDGQYHGIIPLAYMIATAKGTDTGAYTVGRIAGRHKLWPEISPNKTIEGAIGGLFAGIGASLIVAAVARYLLQVPTLSWQAAAGFGFLVSTAAQLGDLMESMIKRDCAQKDASSAVPGFGGVLDVLDSLLFAAPVAFTYWLAFGP